MSARLGFVAAAIALAAALPSTASAASDLGAFWHLDESSGPSAADSSGNPNHGVVNGATRNTGRFGRSLTFDGVDDNVSIVSSDSIKPPRVTVEAWVRGTNPGAGRYIIGQGAYLCEVASYALYTGSGGGAAFYISNGSDDQLAISPEAPATIWDGAWHHLAGTYDGSTVRMFVDGTQIGAGTATPIQIGYDLPNPNASFGAFGGGPCVLNWAGSLDEPRVWRRALSSQEISASAAMGDPATTLFGQRIESNQAITYTSAFSGRTVVISTESATGTEQIDNIKLVGLLPLTSRATCSGGLLSILNSTCTITKSNGDRTARVTVKPLLGRPTVTLRVNMKSGRSFNVTVDTG